MSFPQTTLSTTYGLSTDPLPTNYDRFWNNTSFNAFVS